MANVRIVFVCSVCHRVGEQILPCHPGTSVECEMGEPGGERSLPLFDQHGHLLTRAPKWWVEECFKSKKEKVKR